MDLQERWSTGVVFGLPIVLIILASLFIVGWLCLRWYYRNDNNADAPFMYWAGRVFQIMGILFALGMAWGYYPYQGEYHKWMVKEGEVTQIDKRLVGSGEGMEEKFVVVLEGDSQQYGCLDTRCASVHEGDTLALLCKKSFEWAATDGYDCKWGAYSPKEK